MSPNFAPRVLARTLVVASVLLGTVLLAAAAGDSRKFVSLFNGRDLSGWKVPAGNAHWRVERGVLVGESDAKLTGSMLWTEKSYGDFAFELEARWDGDPDSGVFMRTPALQVQVGTSISQKRDLTGSFYLKGYPEHAQAKEAGKYLKRGEWNTLRIEARGTTFTVSINGHPVSRFSDASYAAPGPIGVQIHQKLKMRIEFRNIRVAELN